MCILCFPCRLGKLTQAEAHWNRTTLRSRYQKTGKESGRKGGRRTKGRVCSVWFLLSWGLPAFMDAKPLPSSPSCLCFSPTYPVLSLFPGNSDGKKSACNVEDLCSFPGSGRSPGEGHGNPLHILAWRIPWTEEPGELQPMGSQRVRYDWATNTQTPYFRIPSQVSFSVCSLSETLQRNQLQRWSRSD